MQPYRLAQRMIDEQQWILRNIIIWHKPNCMPSSVTDRFTVDYEPILFFSKSKKYFFERQFEKYTAPMNRWGGDKLKADGKSDWDKETGQDTYRERNMRPNEQGRNKRCVWKIPTQPFPEAHFAVYPEELVATPIKAGCPKEVCKKCGKARHPIFKAMQKQHSIGATSGAYLTERDFKGDNTVVNTSKKTGYTKCKCKAGFRPGIVLDPFMGAGTTAVVARQLHRDYLGIELSAEYIKIAKQRLKQKILI